MTVTRAVTSTWRIEFHTNLTKVGAEIIPIAYIREANWTDGRRWLGALYRSSLTTNELRAANLATWPQLKQLGPFMADLFENVWAAEPSQGLTDLGRRLSCTSALQVWPADANFELPAFDNWDETFKWLEDTLSNLEPLLQPVLGAAVLPFPNLKEIGKIERRAA